MLARVMIGCLFLLASCQAQAHTEDHFQKDEGWCGTPSSPETLFAHDLREGGLVLFNEVAAGQDNVVFSPYAVQAAMGMMYASASGATATEVANTMRWSGPPLSVAAGFSAENDFLATSAAQNPNMALELANRLWASTHDTVVPEYADVLAAFYDAPIATLDLSGDPEGSRATINTWVDTQTSHAIKDLLPPDSLNDATLVQTAALHFKAPWANIFTRDGIETSFYVNPPNGTCDTDVVPVTMVRTEGKFLYNDTPLYQAAEIPYEGGYFSMLVIMPKDGLPTFAASLDANGLETLQSAMVYNDVVLSLPAFTTRTTPDMTSIFQALGLNIAMSDDASFGVFSNVGTKILKIFEQAWIAVDEKGTEAAAAAAIVGGPTSAPPGDPATLTLDHPFLYIIHDSANVPLFIGQVGRPSSTSSL